ncbi:MFS transporter [Frigoribacterium sp. 2-23]|uniref:MFS transporter n=1 Tax=Frigoribacterium sp. 2-23 TaxID=3415006 RepID=UPI003C6FAA5D
MTDAALPTSGGGVLSRAYWLVTVGMCAVIGIAAFESLAVTTVMPIISAQLHGEALYSMSFAAPLATGLVGMVVAGNWADRSGPRVVVVTSVVVFAIGLLIVGLAPDMTVLLLGRLCQGFGSGAVIVALYVMVARLYPPELHPSIFAGFAAAWVVPALVGPLVAGAVTQALSWHWVFFGAVALAVPAFAMILPSLRSLEAPVFDDPASRPRWSLSRIAWAVGAAAGVLLLNLVGEMPAALAVVVIVVALVVLAVALRPLLPTGTLRAAAGLPTLVLLRGLVGAAFLSAEIYVPYMLASEYDFAPTASGITLTLGALAWSFASWLQGRLGDRVPHRVGIRVGIVLVLIGLAAAIATPLWHLSPAVLIPCWTAAGFGVGFMYPRFSVLVLSWSRTTEQGFNSSALTIADSAGTAVALALVGAAFAAFGGMTQPAAFVACFAVAGAIALLALAASGRAVPRRAS